MVVSSAGGGGYGNVIIGESANTNLGITTGNIGIGYQALRSYNGGAGYNVCIGHSSLGSLTNGTANIAIGTLSLQYITNNQGNLAVGSTSLPNLLIGNYNTGIGFNSCATLKWGGNNTFLGTQAGMGLVTGSFNVIIGGGYSLPDIFYTGSYNVIIGTNFPASTFPTTMDKTVVIANGSGSIVKQYDSDGTPNPTKGVPDFVPVFLLMGA